MSGASKKNKTFNHDEAIEKSVEYFKGNEISADVFVNKWALKNSRLELVEDSPVKMHERLISEFVRIENKFPNPISEEEISEMIKDFCYLVPGGSPMFGIGNIYQTVSLSNCFVIKTVDSYGGICKADERIAQISKRRGGVGLDISEIRPKGVPTRNSAFTTDGITVFMERFSNTSREVAQSGRRGALMLTISVHHPEIINFIRIKRDLQKVTGANISVRVTDEFMNAVQNNKKVELRWPIDSPNPVISEKMDAKDIWDELVKSNYLSAEPGILFWDNIIRNSPADCYSEEGFNTCSTNPCLTGEILVYVADGRGNVPIKELADEGKDVPVFCYDDKGKISVETMRHPRVMGYNHPIYKVTLDDGSIVRATANHKFLNTDGEYKRVDELKEGESLKILTKYEAPMPSAIKTESGSRSKRDWQKYARKNGLPIEFSEWRKDSVGSVLDLSKWAAIECGLEHVNEDPRLIKTLQSMVEQGYNSFIDGNQVFVEKTCEECGGSFTKEHRQREVGFCSGSCANYYKDRHGVNNKRTLTINNTYKKKSDKNKHEQLKIFTGLKFDLGRIPLCKEWEKGCKNNNVSYRLKTKHGFQSYMEVKESAEIFNHRVVSVELDGYEDVYNGTVDKFHNFFVGGFEGKTNHNKRKSLYINNLQCGELPLCEADSCRLMALNLSSYVDNSFTDEASFNWEKFRNHVVKAERLMDDLVEMEIEAVESIIEKIRKDPEDEETKANELSLWLDILHKCNSGRRTGLGITALGDCIAMCNIKYGTEESIEMVDNIYRTLRDEAYRSSIIMAKERGAFPVFDKNKEIENEYLGRLPSDLREEMNKVGRRNIGILTTPPAGSGSTVAKMLDLFGTTSGFEPVFMAEHKRKRKLMDSDKEKADFTDQLGDKWKEYIITHSGLEMFKRITGKSFEESPYYGAQAEDLDYFMRVKMQAAATKYVDHAISSTINLPNDISMDVVSQLYITAWENGCKGLTVYRAGSRDGVLTSMNSTRHCEDCDEASKGLVALIEKGARPNNVIVASAPKRPDIVECDIHRSKVGGGDWLFFVGKINGKPYEVFGGENAEFTIPQKYKSGWIKKNGKIDGVSQYNLLLGCLNDEDGQIEFKGISKHFNNYEYGAFTRLTSLTIRHGTPIKYVCEQITKKGVEGDLFSFQRAMARVLKKYISEGEKSETECPTCGSKEVVYRNGCPTCQLCGHSNCS